MTGTPSPRRRDNPRGWQDWLATTAFAAGVATLLDSILLQMQRSYFTGGFLAVDYVSNTAQAGGFLAGSLLSDALALAGPVGVGLWCGQRLRFPRGAAMMCAALLALTPIAIANVIEYQLVTFFGDAFDLGVMFRLAGSNPAELIAVSYPRLVRLALLGGGVVIVLAGVWLIRGRWQRPSVTEPAVPLRAVTALTVAMLLVGAVSTAAFRVSSDAIDNGIRRKPTGRLFGFMVRVATDVDRDGAGMLDRPPDPALLDADVSPYAVDVPGNGVDENGIGGDLPPGSPYLEREWSTSQWSSRQDVVLILLESFRADVVGQTVNGVAVTPHLDALAASGIALDHAYSHNGYTVQSRRHLFTGSVTDFDRATTIIDDFNARGYETAYFSGQDESFGGLGRGVGFERAAVAYDARADRDRRYSRFTTAGSLAVPASVVLERVKAFLAARDRSRPLFLYVNFHDTHFPYHHSAMRTLVSSTILSEADIAPRRKRELWDMYLNSAANVDAAVGELLAATLQSLGRTPGVIVLSDHGESLYEEGFLGHGYALNDAQTRVPLIVANLPMPLHEPFGQSDLRGALHEAMHAPSGTRSSVDRRTERRLFQYVGTIDRPAQIAFRAKHNRVIYDLRRRHARFGDGPWRADATLTNVERQQVTELLHTWERMILARRQSQGE